MQIPTESYEDGIEQIKSGETVLLINFPTNYETHFKNRLAYLHYSSNETVQGSTTSVRMIESGTIF